MAFSGSYRKTVDPIYNIRHNGLTAQWSHSDFMGLLDAVGVLYQFRKISDTRAVLEIYGGKTVMEFDVENYSVGDELH